MVREDQIVIMKKLFKKYTFIVYSDGTYQEIFPSGVVSDFFPDFADMFLKLYDDNFRQVRG